MKTLMVLFVVAFSAAFIGCQDNGSMSPLASQEPTIPDLSRESPDIRFILDAIVNDPSPLYGQTRILGGMAVRLEGESRLLTLSVRTDADLWPVDGTRNDPRWSIACLTIEPIKLPLDTRSFSFCKDYVIAGRTDGIQLCIEFCLLCKPGTSHRTLRLDRVHLESVRRVQQAANID